MFSFVIISSVIIQGHLVFCTSLVEWDIKPYWSRINYPWHESYCCTLVRRVCL